MKWLPHIPKQWQNFIRKCLADDPDKRYLSAESLQTAITKLPAEPNWKCDYTPKLRSWCREKADRKIVVTHTIHSSQKHEWKALSYPINGKGRVRKLDGSNGIISQQAVTRELTTFLARG